MKLKIKDKGLKKILRLSKHLKLTCEFDKKTNCSHCGVKLTKINIGMESGEKYYCDNPGCTIHA